MNIFQENIHKYEFTTLKLGKVLNRLSVFRLVAFIFSITLLIIFTGNGWITLVLIAAPLFILGFGLLVKRYNQIAYKKRHTTFLKEINEDEVLRLENKLSGFADGRTFVDRNHPYISDLDIFGPHSLFQLLNRTTTESGSLCLAKWLSEFASKDVILERQKAIKELSPMLDWRQHFQASGMHFKNPKDDYNKLLDWLEKPVQLLPHESKYLIVRIVLPILSTSAAIYYFIHAFSADWVISIIPLFIISLINFFVLRKVKQIAEETIDSTHRNIKILGGYHALITKIETEKFSSNLLQHLQSTFTKGGYSAANEINKLKKILDRFKLRGTKATPLGNQFYSVFNILWLFDIHWIILTEKWKCRNKSHLRPWISALSEFEVLCSLAGFSYSNPGYAFPETTENSYSIHFETLGHPLISSEKRICNDFNLDGRGKIAVITGSNMAGKSTFLRTVGINLVLAFMGAPCCAASGKVSNIQLFTSMRTQDNLEEGISSFRAELKRIEQLLNLLKSGDPIFFLLDEMFKGTNSQDRYKGGVSLIRQLSELNAFGIISTHDLGLARLAGNHLSVANCSFNSKILEGEMTFDYKLSEGICQDFNASELMKKSGIKILSDIEKMSK